LDCFPISLLPISSSRGLRHNNYHLRFLLRDPSKLHIHRCYDLFAAILQRSYIVHHSCWFFYNRYPVMACERDEVNTCFICELMYCHVLKKDTKEIRSTRGPTADAINSWIHVWRPLEEGS